MCVRGEGRSRESKKIEEKKKYMYVHIRRKKNKKTNKKLRKRIRYVCIVFFWATNFSLMSSDPCMTNKKIMITDIIISIQDIYICNIIKYNCIMIITFIGILNSWILRLDI